MNLTKIIDLKERIAVSDAFTPNERNFILECISIAMRRMTGLTEHELVGETLVREEIGIVARCTCGWTSNGHFSSMAASVAFRAHQEGAK
jgi:hypothetical protein